MAKSNEKVNFDTDGEKVITGGAMGSIRIAPGKAVIIKAGVMIGGHAVNTDQTVTNTTDSTVELVFNEETNSFNLQPAGEAIDLS